MLKLPGRPLHATTAFLLAVILLVGCTPGTPLSSHADQLHSAEVARAAAPRSPSRNV